MYYNNSRTQSLNQDTMGIAQPFQNASSRPSSLPPGDEQPLRSNSDLMKYVGSILEKSRTNYGGQYATPARPMPQYATYTSPQFKSRLQPRIEPFTLDRPQI
jgi:hypothetical protein